MKTRQKKRPPSHPGKILKGLYLDPFSITTNKLADALKLSRNTISKIINEKSAVTPDIALRLSKAFGTSPGVWLNLQKNYDLWHAEHDSKEWRKVTPIVVPVQEFD